MILNLTCVSLIGVFALSFGQECAVPAKAVSGIDGCPAIIDRDEWCADPPTQNSTERTAPFKYVVIHSSNQNISCQRWCECSNVVRDMQTWHMTKRKFFDIGYHFVVCTEGTVYEGRGWDSIGWHIGRGDLTTNHDSLGIVVIGYHQVIPPPAIQLNSTLKLIDCGVKGGYISPDYKLYGHQQLARAPNCPGEKLYEIIKTWNNWTIAIP